MTILLGVIFGIISLIGWGISDYWGALASRKIGAFETSTITRGLAAFVLVFLLPLFLYQLYAIPLFDVILIALTGACVLIGTTAFYKGTNVGNVSIVSAIANSWSVITLVLSLIFLNLTMAPNEIAAVVIIIIGTILVSFKLNDLKSLRLGKLVKGAPYAFLAMFIWGLQFFFLNIVVRQVGWFPPSLLVYLTVTIYAAMYIKKSKIKLVKPRPVWLILVLNGVAIAIAAAAYNIGVTSIDALVVAPIAAASPAVTMALAMVRLKERPEINQLTGMILIVASLVLLSL